MSPLGMNFIIDNFSDFEISIVFLYIAVGPFGDSPLSKCQVTAGHFSLLDLVPRATNLMSAGKGDQRYIHLTSCS